MTIDWSLKTVLKGVEKGEFPDGRSELLNFYDIQYIANITLGSPAQDLTVLLGTVSPLFFERQKVVLLFVNFCLPEK